MRKNYDYLYVKNNFEVPDNVGIPIVTSWCVLLSGTITSFYNMLIMGSFCTFTGIKLGIELDEEVEWKDGLFDRLYYLWKCKPVTLLKGLISMTVYIVTKTIGIYSAYKLSKENDVPIINFEDLSLVAIYTSVFTDMVLIPLFTFYFSIYKVLFSLCWGFETFCNQLVGCFIWFEDCMFTTIFEIFFIMIFAEPINIYFSHFYKYYHFGNERSLKALVVYAWVNFYTNLFSIIMATLAIIAQAQRFNDQDSEGYWYYSLYLTIQIIKFAVVYFDILYRHFWRCFWLVWWQQVFIMLSCFPTYFGRSLNWVQLYYLQEEKKDGKLDDKHYNKFMLNSINYMVAISFLVWFIIFIFNRKRDSYFELVFFLLNSFGSYCCTYLAINGYFLLSFLSLAEPAWHLTWSTLYQTDHKILSLLSIVTSAVSLAWCIGTVTFTYLSRYRYIGDSNLIAEKYEHLNEYTTEDTDL